MAFLIFAYMKQSLRLKIDRGQYREMVLTNKINTLHDQISVIQQAQENVKSMTQMTLGNLNNVFGSSFQNQSNLFNQSAIDANNAYNKAVEDARTKGTDPTKDTGVQDAQKRVQEAQQNAYTQSMQAQQKYQAFQLMMTSANAALNSVFDNADKCNLQALQCQESSITQEKTTLETDLKSWQAQYDAYDKAEDQSVKDVAPKFGLTS